MNTALRAIVVVGVYALVVLAYWLTGQRAAVVGTSLDATALDRELPVIPALVVPYLLYFPFLLWVFLRLAKEPCFWRDLIPILAVVVVSVGTFLVWPTRIERAPFEGDSFACRLLTAVRAVDAPGNCVPSLHASLTVLACLLAARHRFLGVLSAIAIAVCIIASTVLVKQHLLVDAGAGVFLALVFDWSLVRRPGERGATCCAKECLP